MMDTEVITKRNSVPAPVERDNGISFLDIEPTTIADIVMIFTVVSLISAGAFRYAWNAIGVFQ